MVVAAAHILDRLYGRPAQATDLALKAEAIDVSALISPRWLRRQGVDEPVCRFEWRSSRSVPLHQLRVARCDAVLLNMAHLKHQLCDNAPATSILAVRRSVQVGTKPSLNMQANAQAVCQFY